VAPPLRRGVRRDANRELRGVRAPARVCGAGAAHRGWQPHQHAGRAGLPPAGRAPAGLAQGLGDPVERHRQQHDAQPADGGQAHVEAADAAQHHLTEAADGDHGGDHHHRQRQHQRLVDAGHDGRHGQRELHLHQQLPGRRAIGPGGFDEVRPHLPDAERRQAHEWRQREHDRDDHARHVADAEQHHDRHQVDEGRRGLHGIEHGARPALRAVAGGEQDPQRQSQQQAEHQGGEHERERDHGVGPDAQHVHDQQRHHRADGDAAAGELPGEQADQRRERQRRCALQQVRHAAQRGIDRAAHRLERRPEVQHRPVEAAVDPVVHR